MILIKEIRIERVVLAPVEAGVTLAKLIDMMEIVFYLFKVIVWLD
jgi:hypothetical protein